MRNKILMISAVTLLVGGLLYQIRESTSESSVLLDGSQSVGNRSFAKAGNKESSDLKNSIGESQPESKELSSWESTFSQVQSVEEIMSRFRTRSVIELRQEVSRMNQFAEDHKLFQKANSGDLDKVGRIQLAYVVRTQTALHHLLLERELEKN